MTVSPFLLEHVRHDPRRVIGSRGSVRPPKRVDASVEARVWEPTAWHDSPTAGPVDGDPSSTDEPLGRPAGLQFSESELAQLMARAVWSGRESGQVELRHALEAAQAEAIDRIATRLGELDAARSDAIQATAAQVQTLLAGALDCLTGGIADDTAVAAQVATIERCLDRLQGPIEVEIRVATALAGEIAERLDASDRCRSFSGSLDVVADDGLEPGAVAIDWGTGNAVRSPERIRELIVAEWSRLGDPARPVLPTVADDREQLEQEEVDEC